MGPPSYMRSVVDRNVVMPRMTMQQGTHSKTRYSHKPILRDLSEYSIAPSPLDNRQAFTVTEEDIVTAMVWRKTPEQARAKTPRSSPPQPVVHRSNTKET